VVEPGFSRNADVSGSDKPAGCQDPKPGRGSVQTRARPGVSAGSSSRRPGNRKRDREVRRRFVRARKRCQFQESLVRWSQAFQQKC